MSFLYEPLACYSNECHHLDADDTFEIAQARQHREFAEELVKQRWLTNVKESVTKTECPVPPAVIKMKADKLLRMTKNRALARLSAA